MKDLLLTCQFTLSFIHSSSSAPAKGAQKTNKGEGLKKEKSNQFGIRSFKNKPNNQYLIKNFISEFK